MTPCRLVDMCPAPPPPFLCVSVLEQVTAASLGIWWQTTCLTAAVAVLLFPQFFPLPDFPPAVPDTKLVLFIVLVVLATHHPPCLSTAVARHLLDDRCMHVAPAQILSRFGLYLFDVAVVQVFQVSESGTLPATTSVAVLV